MRTEHKHISESFAKSGFGHLCIVECKKNITDSTNSKLTNSLYKKKTEVHV